MPEEDAKLLGHEEIVSNLMTFIDSENMITPISIAIHGEWGSGKTSIMKTIENKLKSSSMKTVFFEAWRYEYSNPSIGLINQVLTKSALRDEQVIQILSTAAKVLLKQFGGIDLSMDAFVKVTRDAPDDFTKQFEDAISEQFGDKKIVIIIDDLDRCDPENALQLLALLKLFLDIKNMICIAAVDFTRLEQAWKHKYGVMESDYNNQNKKDEGRNYLDKIFQLKIGIPTPSIIQVEDYVRKLITNISPEIIDMISHGALRNPRAIKRLLNLISFRGNAIINTHSRTNSDTTFAYESACIWTLLDEINSNDQLFYFFDAMKKQSISSANSLAQLITCYGNQWDVIKSIINQLFGSKKHGFFSDKAIIIFKNSHNLCQQNNISTEILEKHFEILYDTTNESNN